MHVLVERSQYDSVGQGQDFGRSTHASFEHTWFAPHMPPHGSVLPLPGLLESPPITPVPLPWFAAVPSPLPLALLLPSALEPPPVVVTVVPPAEHAMTLIAASKIQGEAEKTDEPMSKTFPRERARRRVQAVRPSRDRLFRRQFAIGRDRARKYFSGERKSISGARCRSVATWRP